MISRLTSPAPPRPLTDELKNAVRAWVPGVRKLLEEDFAAQLDRLGLRRDGKHVPVGKVLFSPERLEARRRMEALLERETLAEGTPERGFDNVRRELAYTLLNRLLALKAMEVRGLLYLPPPDAPSAPPERTEVITPVPGQAYSRYLRDLRAAGGARYKYEGDAEEALLRDGLGLAFAHITQEIGILFDPSHEYAALWPTHGALTRVIGMINQGLPEQVFAAQDFPGWVYQFFNREEKIRIRKETGGTPRTSYELAVINQFYTPSWIVKVLVDNTLGRLWLQMHPDSSLRPEGPPPLPGEGRQEAVCADYLIPRTGERIPYRVMDDTGAVHSFKRVRDITLLDPACGTMHFGQYAFGLFHRMYLEEIQNAGKPGWPEEPSVPDPRDVPGAILERNLYGIDIDPRAIQIAALSLLLTAKEAAVAHGFSPTEVRVRKTNLVVANAVGIGQDRLRALVTRVAAFSGEAPLQERLFKAIWENLESVPELGSLVQLREGVQKVLGDWVRKRAREKGLVPVGSESAQAQFGFDAMLSEVDEQEAVRLHRERALLEQEARELEAELLEGVAAAAAESTADPRERLFAEDTARGLKLLQLLSRRYDVIVMNPPYGAFVPKVKKMAEALYPATSRDIYQAFLDRATQLVWPHGYIGALVSRTFVALVSARRLREEILLKRNPLVAMLDLGAGILDDATVEAAAIVCRGSAQ